MVPPPSGIHGVKRPFMTPGFQKQDRLGIVPQANNHALGVTVRCSGPLSPEVTMGKDARGLFKSDSLVVPDSTVTPTASEEAHLLLTQCLLCLLTL